jgi:hypothetical protein
MQNQFYNSRRCTPQQVNIRCGCGYGWRTNSNLKRLSCPSCNSKILNPNKRGV